MQEHVLCTEISGCQWAAHVVGVGTQDAGGARVRWTARQVVRAAHHGVLFYVEDDTVCAFIEEARCVCGQLTLKVDEASGMPPSVLLDLGLCRYLPQAAA